MAAVAFPLPTQTPAPRRRTTRDQDREALKLVRPARTRALPRAGRAPSAVVRRRAAWAVVSLIAVVALAVSACQVLIAQSQFELARLQADAATAEDRYDRLRLHVAELESPGRIMATAQERLGMVPPPGVTYLTPVPSESATPADSPARTNDEAVADDWSRIKPILATRP